MSEMTRLLEKYYINEGLLTSAGRLEYIFSGISCVLRRTGAILSGVLFGRETVFSVTHGFYYVNIVNVLSGEQNCCYGSFGWGGYMPAN